MCSLAYGLLEISRIIVGRIPVLLIIDEPISLNVRSLMYVSIWVVRLPDIECLVLYPNG